MLRYKIINMLKAVIVRNLTVRKNIVNATKLDWHVILIVNVKNVKIYKIRGWMDKEG